MTASVTRTQAEAAYAEAKAWAEVGYTPESKAYWQGMRDTLAVILGITTKPPTVTGPGADIAADLLLRKRG